MNNLGYKRVSTVEQNTDRQLHGLELDYCWIDKCSGSTKNRPQLIQMLSESCSLRKGDILHVHSIDRLARNLKDLINIINDVNDRGVTLKFHKENLEFKPEKSDPIQNLMLQIMGSCYEFERSLIRERQLEGIRISKLKGKRFGRPVTITDELKSKIRNEVNSGISKSEVSKRNGISRTKVYQILDETY